MRRLTLLCSSLLWTAACSSEPTVRTSSDSKVMLQHLRNCAAQMSADETEWRPEAERAFEDAALAARRRGDDRIGRILDLGHARDSARAGEALDRALRGQSTRDLVLDLGPGASAPRHEVPLHQLQAGLVVDIPWLEVLQTRLHECEESLLAPSIRSRRPMRDQVVIATPILVGGTLEEPRITTRLPRDPDLRARLGALTIVWRDPARDRWFSTDVRPLALSSLTPSLARRVTARAHLAWYATRWLAFQLGVQPDRAALGDADGPSVIARADVMATLMQLWLVDQGLQPPEFADEMLATLVTMALAQATEARAGTAPPPHGAAAALILDTLSTSNAIVRTSSGRWAWTPATLRRALHSLAHDLVAPHHPARAADTGRWIEEQGVIIERSTRRPRPHR